MMYLSFINRISHITNDKKPSCGEIQQTDLRNHLYYRE